MQPETLQDISNLGIEPGTAALLPGHGNELVLNNTLNYVGDPALYGPNPTSAQTYVSGSQTDWFTVHFGNCTDPNTLVSLEWILYENGHPILTEDLSRYADIYIYTRYDQLANTDNVNPTCGNMGWLGGHVTKPGVCTEVHNNCAGGYPGALADVDNSYPYGFAGFISSGYTRLSYYNFDAFRYSFLQNSVTRIAIKWNQIGDYSLVVRLRERTGGGAGVGQPGTDNFENLGANGTCCGQLLASDSLHYLVTTTSQKAVCDGAYYEYGNPLAIYSVEGNYNVLFGEYTCDHWEIDHIDLLSFYTRINPDIVANNATICVNEPFTAEDLAALAPAVDTDAPGLVDYKIYWKKDGDAAFTTTVPTPDFRTVGTTTYYVYQENHYDAVTDDDFTCAGAIDTITFKVLPVIAPILTCDPQYQYCNEEIDSNSTLTLTAELNNDAENNCADHIHWFLGTSHNGQPAFDGLNYTLNLIDVYDNNNDKEVVYTAYSFDESTETYSTTGVSVTLNFWRTPELAANETEDTIVVCPFTRDIELLSNFTSTNFEDEDLDWDYAWAKNEIAINTNTKDITVAAPGCAKTDVYTVTAYVESEHGCISEITRTFTVSGVDTIAPVITWNTTFETEVELEGCNLDVVPTAMSLAELKEVTKITDNCNNNVTVYNHSDEVILLTTCEKQLKRTYTVTDACGNTSEPISMTYTVINNNVPAIVGDVVTLDPVRPLNNDCKSNLYTYAELLAFFNANFRVSATCEGTNNDAPLFYLNQTKADPADSNLDIFANTDLVTVYAQVKDECGHYSAVTPVFNLYKPEAMSIEHAFDHVTELCNNESAQIYFDSLLIHNGLSPYSYAWDQTPASQCNIEVAEDNVHITVWPIRGGEFNTAAQFIMTVTDAYGCVATDTSNAIQFYGIPTVTIVERTDNDDYPHTGDPIVVCPTFGHYHLITVDDANLPDSIDQNLTYTWSGEAIDFTSTSRTSFIAVNHNVCDFTYLATVNVVNKKGCAASAQYSIVAKDTVAPVITVDMPTDTIRSLNNCKIVIPNYTTLFNASTISDKCWGMEDIVVSQAPVAGTIVSENTDVVITVAPKCGPAATYTIKACFPEPKIETEIIATVDNACYPYETVLSTNTINAAGNVIVKWDGTTVANTLTVNPTETAGLEHTVVVTDENGCEASAEYTLVVFHKPVAADAEVESTPNHYCDNVNTDASFTVTAVNSEIIGVRVSGTNQWHTLPYTVNNVPVGTYYFDLKTIHDCVSDAIISVEVVKDTVDPIVSLDLALVTDNAYCVAPWSGTIRVVNPIDGYRYHISQGAENSGNKTITYVAASQSPLTFNFLFSDTYTVDILSTFNCHYTTEPITVSDHRQTPAVPAYDVTALTNCENPNGMITLRNTRADYDYTINNITRRGNGNVLVFANLNSGTYNLTIASPYTKCDTTVEIEVLNSISNPVAIYTTTPDEYCVNGNGTLTITPVDGYSYTFNGETQSGANVQFVGLDAGNYVLYVLDVNTNCRNQYDVVIVDSLTYPTFAANEIKTSPRTVCVGTPDGSMLINEANGYTYTVYFDGEVVNVLSNLDAGDYTIVKRNIVTGCESSTVATVGYDRPSVALTLSATDDIDCSEIGTAVITPTLEPNVAATYTVTCNDQTYTLSGLNAGVYHVVATVTETGCEYDSYVQVNSDFTYPELTATSTPNYMCVDAKNGTISVSDTQDVKNYSSVLYSLYSIDNVPQSLLSETFETGGLPAGWSIIDQDGDGYNWVFATGFNSHTGNGVVYSQSYDNYVGILYPDNWLVTPAVTLNENADLYFWTVAQDQDWPNDNFSVYVATNNTVDAFLASNPVLSSSTTSVWEQRTVDLSSFTGQTVYIAFRHHNSSDQYFIDLDDVEIITKPASTPISSNVVGLNSGVYTIGATTDNHCSAEPIEVVVVDSAFIVRQYDVKPNSMCNPTVSRPGNGSIQVLRPAVETCDYIFTYLGGEGYDVDHFDPIDYTKFDLKDGRYRIQITDNLTGCTSDDIVQVPFLPVSVTVDSISSTPDYLCTGANGSVYVHATCESPSAVLEYSLDGQNFQSSNVFNNLEHGTYSVTVKNLTTNCEYPAIANIEVLEDVYKINVNFNNVANTACNPTLYNGEVRVSASYVDATLGTGNFNYAISGGSFTGLNEGVYTVTVTDVNTGCTYTYETTVENDNEYTPVVTIVAHNRNQNPEDYHFCYGQTDGSFEASAETSLAGDVNFTYEWSSSCNHIQPVGAWTNVYARQAYCCTYTVKVTSNLTGCSKTEQVKVCIDTLPAIHFIADGPSIHQTSSTPNATFENCINKPFTFGIIDPGFQSINWTNSHVGTEATFVVAANELPVGQSSYCVKVVDYNGCAYGPVAANVITLPTATGEETIVRCNEYHYHSARIDSTFRYVAGGVNTHTLIDTFAAANTCDSVVTYTIIINTDPSIVSNIDAELVAPHCAGSSIIESGLGYVASDAVNSGWRLVANPLTLAPTNGEAFDPTAALTEGMNGQYVFAFASNSCNIVVTDPIQLTVTNVPTLADEDKTLFDTVVCSGSVVPFAAPAIADINWHHNVGTATFQYSADNASTWNTVTADLKLVYGTDYQFRFVAGNMCDTVVLDGPVSVTVNDVPVATVHTLAADTVCNGSVSNFVAPTINWKGNQGRVKFQVSVDGGVFEDTTANIEFTYGHTYSVQYVAENKCSEFTVVDGPVAIKVNDKPSTLRAVLSDRNACDGDVVEFSVPSVSWNGDEGTATFQVMVDGGEWIDTTRFIVVSYGHTYSVRYVATNMCGTDELIDGPVTITVRNTPVITDNAQEVTLCAGEPLTFAAPEINWRGIAGDSIFQVKVGNSAWVATDARSINVVYGFDYQVRFIAANECGFDTTTLVTATVIDAPVIAESILDTTVCAGTELTLTIPSVNWKGNEGTAQLQVKVGDAAWTASPATVTFNYGNPYAFRYVVANDCGYDTAAVAFITVTDQPTATNTLEDKTVCAGTDVTFTVPTVDYHGAAGTAQFQVKVDNAEWTAWTNGSSFTYGHTYQVRYVAQNVCTDGEMIEVVAPVTVTVNTTPERDGDATLAAATVCEGVTSFTAPAVNWNGDEGTATFQVKVNSGAWTDTVANIDFVYGNDYEVQYVATNDCGTTVIDGPVTIKVRRSPIITGTLSAADFTVCDGQGTFTLNAPVYNVGSFANTLSTSWQINKNGVFETINPATKYDLSYNGAIAYYIVENECGFDSVSVAITVNEIPVPSVFSDTNICQNGTAILTATPGFVSYRWFNGETPVTAATPSNTYAFTTSAEGTYHFTVEVVDANGCVSTETVNGSTDPRTFAVEDAVTVSVTSNPGFIFTHNGVETHYFEANTTDQNSKYTWMVSNPCDYNRDQLVFVNFDIYYNGQLIDNDSIGNYIVAMDANPNMFVEDLYVSSDSISWFTYQNVEQHFITRYNFANSHSYGDNYFTNHFPIGSMNVSSIPFDELYLHFLTDRPVYKTINQFKKAGEYKIVYTLVATTNGNIFNHGYYNENIDEYFTSFGGHNSVDATAILTTLAVDEIIISVTGEDIVEGNENESAEPIVAENDEPSMKIYPNPAVNGSTINAEISGISGNVVVRIVNLAGNTVAQESVVIPAGTSTYNYSTIVNKLPAGTYFIYVQGDARKERVSKKLVITK